MQEPPFIVGKPVVGEYFVDREKELERLLSLTKGLEKGSSSNSVLIGLRRTGKTSILHNLAQQLGSNTRIVTMLVSCYGISTRSRFAKILVDSALSNYTKKTGDNAYVKKIVRKLGETAKAAKGAVSELEYEDFSVKLRDPETDEDVLIEKALEYIQSLAEERRVFFVVMLDEFQDVISWGDKTLKRIRSVIQEQKRVCYVLSGSATTIMHDLVYETRSPFYRQLVDIPVKKLDSGVVKSFLKERFASVKIKVNDSELSKMATYCEGFPDYVQRLGLELYLSTGPGGTIDASQIDKAYEDMLLNLDGELQNYFKAFSPTEKEILLAIAGGKSKASEIAREARKPIQNISKDLGILMNYGVVERPMTGQYRMADPVFADWIKRRFSSEEPPS